MHFIYTSTLYRERTVCDEFIYNTDLNYLFQQHTNSLLTIKCYWHIWIVNVSVAINYSNWSDITNKN